MKISDTDAVEPVDTAETSNGESAFQQARDNAQGNGKQPTNAADPSDTVADIEPPMDATPSDLGSIAQAATGADATAAMKGAAAARPSNAAMAEADLTAATEPGADPENLAEIDAMIAQILNPGGPSVKGEAGALLDEMSAAGPAKSPQQQVADALAVANMSGNTVGAAILTAAQASLNANGAISSGSDTLAAGQVMGSMGAVISSLGGLKGNKELMIAGRVLDGVGSVVKTASGALAPPEGMTQTEAVVATSAKSAGSVVSLIGSLEGNQELATAGTVMSQGFEAWQQFEGGNTGQGSAAVGQAIAAIVGGETGRIISSTSSIASSVMGINSGAISPEAGWTQVVRTGLDLVGADIPPEANYFANIATTAAVGGPFAWASLAVGTLMNFANMGSFTVENELADNLDLDGDMLNDDMAELRQEFRRGFFGNVGLSNSAIDYHIEGVAQDLMQSVDYSITQETSPARVTSRNGRKGHQTHYINYGTDAQQQITIEQVEGRRDEFTTAYSVNGQQVSSFRQEGRKDSYQTYVNVPTGNYNIDMTATYDGVNPSTNSQQAQSRVTITPDQLPEWQAFLGGDGGRIERGDGRMVDGRIAGQFAEQSVEFQGAKNDPNLYMYMDMNNDGVSDMVRVGLDIDGLKQKGDSKIEVTLLNENREQISDPFWADDFAKAEEIGGMSDMLLNWGAGQPKGWDRGKDAAAFYQLAEDTGRLDDLKGYDGAIEQLLGALAGGDQAVNALLADGSFVANVERMSTDMGQMFDPAAYAALYPDVAQWAGGTLNEATGVYENPDLNKVRQHYLNHGNDEQRAIDGAGTVLNNHADQVMEWTPLQAYSYLAQNTDVAQQVLWDPAGAARHYNAYGRWEGRQTETDFDALFASDPGLRTTMGHEMFQNLQQDGGWRADIMLPGFQEKYGITPDYVRKGEVVTWNVDNMSIRTEDMPNHIAALMTDDEAKTMAAARIIYHNAAGGDWAPYAEHVQHVVANGKSALNGIQEIKGSTPFSDGEVHAYLGDRRNQEFVVETLINDTMDELRANEGSIGATLSVTNNPNYAGKTSTNGLMYEDGTFKTTNTYWDNGEKRSRYKTRKSNISEGEAREIIQQNVLTEQQIRDYARIQMANSAAQFVPSDDAPQASGLLDAAPATDLGDRVTMGVRLGVNQMITSANGIYTAAVHSDGNFVVRERMIDGQLKPIWASNTDGDTMFPGVEVQSDGNLVIYDDSDNRALWSSGTNDRDGAARPTTLIMQDDGNLVLYDDAGSNALWASKDNHWNSSHL